MRPTAASVLAEAYAYFYGPGANLRVVFWDGSELGRGDAPGIVHVRSALGLRRVLWGRGELGIARAVVMGEIDIEGDLFEALRQIVKVRPGSKRPSPLMLVRAAAGLRHFGVYAGPLPVPAEEAPMHRRSLHSKSRDADAISHHYDVSNEFYELILGPAMTYSCARYVDDSTSLEDAQAAKHDLVCRKLGLDPGMRLLDVGGGWGSMALHAAKNYGVDVTVITISQQQAEYARKRVALDDLEHRVEVRLLDYRDLAGERFDAISSVGMYEHVGHQNNDAYFASLYEALEPGGRLLNHAISRVGGLALKKRSLMARYVFPNGELQDVANTVSAMQNNGFEVRDVESLREHYARTLRDWVTNLDQNETRATQLVGERRVRIWRLYMAVSSVMFDLDFVNLHQVLAVKVDNNGNSHMPPTRESYV